METCAQQGEFLSFENLSEWLSCYEQDAQALYAKLPLVVFRPFSTAHIAPFLQACDQMDLSVTIRCGGTGLAGGCVPSTEGIILLTGHLKQMRDYDRKKGKICLEPGVTVRQLNSYIEPDHWYFPLSMATEGVAGLAGCLSCQARGYHQQQSALFNAIESVTLVDGQGQILEVPSSLVCGAEGLWGVIIEMQVQLERKFYHQRTFIYQESWQHLLSQLPTLSSLSALTFVIWKEDQFYLKLETEAWRLNSAVAFLLQSLPNLQPCMLPLEKFSHSFLPSQKPFVVISSVFNQASQLPEACQRSLAQAKHLQINCLQQADILAGSLHLILQSEETLYCFKQKIEQFLVYWADFVERQQGALASCHGVGMQMGPYMPPFWSEETQQIWLNMQVVFDPKRLFGKESFFPPIGKSLEKVR